MILEPVVDRLPAGFDEMMREANAEGFRFVKRLRDEWEANERFNQDGEALLAVYVGQTLAAIGGITRDPVVADALRMRRFYVRRAFRGQGIGRQLAEALLDRRTRTVMVNAGRGSSSFWEAIGFVPEMCDGHTHILRQLRWDTHERTDTNRSRRDDP